MTDYPVLSEEFIVEDMVEEKQKLLYPTESYKIMGAAFEVYKTLGSFLREKSYQKAFAREQEIRGIPHTRESYLPMLYKGVQIQNIPADFVVYGKIVVETKATPEIKEKDIRQVHDYLVAGKLDLGIIINFGKQGGVEKMRIVRKGAGYLS